MLAIANVVPRYLLSHPFLRWLLFQRCLIVWGQLYSYFKTAHWTVRIYIGYEWTEFITIGLCCLSLRSRNSNEKGALLKLLSNFLKMKDTHNVVVEFLFFFFGQNVLVQLIFLITLHWIKLCPAVCRQCKYQKLEEDNRNHCPVCNAYLGSFPEELLR